MRGGRQNDTGEASACADGENNKHREAKKKAMLCEAN